MGYDCSNRCRSREIAGQGGPARGLLHLGMAELLAPALEVDGVGPIALPLLPVQAEQLIAVAEAAPYGRGRRP